MKTSILISLLSSFLIYGKMANNNTVKGKINFTAKSELLIQKGVNYQEGSNNSEEKQRLDELNQPRRNVYISLHPLDFIPELTETEGAVITQRAKTFSPNMIAVTKGTTVKFVNEDEHYHNVYSLTRKARFNIGRRPTGNVYGQKINKVGVIKLGCDIHDDMSATIWSLDTPYFTKINEDGTYKIDNLPDGAYEIRIFHPSLIKFSEEIKVEGGVVFEKNLTLEPRV